MTYELLSRSAHDTGLDDRSVHCIVTSPPYWGLRKYSGDQGIEWPSVDYAPMPGLPELHIEPMTCELGLEPTPEMYIGHMVLVMRECWRVLRDDGVMFVNLGDSYASNPASGGSVSSGLNAKRDDTGALSADNKSQGITPRNPKWERPPGLKPKDLCGMPWRLAFALQADGWYLRSDIIWSKKNPMPESVKDRPTKAHEYLFLLSKQKSYYYDAYAVREDAQYGRREWSNVESVLASATTAYDKRDNHGIRTSASVTGGDPSAGRNRRTVWTIATQPTPFAHFATFPQKLVEPCVLAGSRRGDTVLDPFSGSGTVGIVALEHGRHYIGIDISDEYNRDLATKRLDSVQPRLL